MPLGSKAQPLAGKRAAILETIRQSPGINFLGVVKAHALAYGEAAYHLRVLETHELVSSAKVGRFRRYWTTNSGYGPASAVTAAADPLRRAVLERIRATPGASLGELAAAFPDRTRQATAYHVRRLEQAGLVRIESMTRWRRLFAANPVHAAPKGLGATEAC